MVAAARSIRNADASRARILDAARIEFVGHGLNGGRVDRIAERSGVNKNLIYHYFASKEGLYLQVLEAIYVDLRSSQRDEDLRQAHPIEGMRRLIGRTFDHFIATPDLIRLMSVENIHFAENLKRSERIKPLYRDLFTTLENLIGRGQDQGLFRRDVDIVDLYLSISGLAYFFLSNQHTLSWLLDRDLTNETRITARRAHVVDMVMTFLTNTRPNEAASVSLPTSNPEHQT